MWCIVHRKFCWLECNSVCRCLYKSLLQFVYGQLLIYDLTECSCNSKLITVEILCKLFSELITTMMVRENMLVDCYIYSIECACQNEKYFSMINFVKKTTKTTEHAYFELIVSLCVHP